MSPHFIGGGGRHNKRASGRTGSRDEGFPASENRQNGGQILTLQMEFIGLN